MKDEDAPILVYTTLETIEDAKRLAHALVGDGLVACANIFPSMTAVFEWEGAVQEAGETAMILKSRAGVRDRLLKEAKKLHPYDTPALVVLSPSGGDREFFSWIATQTRNPD